MHSHWVNPQSGLKWDEHNSSLPKSFFLDGAYKSYSSPGAQLMKYIFISIPKTGSTTISNLHIHRHVDHEGVEWGLPVEGRDHQGYDIYKGLATHENYDCSINDINERFVFSFVRNPWDRVASIFRNRYKLHRCGDNFEKFVEKYQNASDFHYGCLHYKNQLDWLRDPDTGKIMADFIGRFENFDHDVTHVMKRISVDNKLWYDELPNMNGDGPVFDLKDNKSYRDLYTSWSKDVIYEKCKEDIEYFNYEF